MQSSSGNLLSGRPAYMGGVSAVLYRLVVPARPVKMFASCPNVRGHEYFHLFSGNFRRSLGADCSAPRTLIKELWRRKLFILVSSFKRAPLGPRGRGHRGAVSKRGGAGAYIFTIFWGQKSISASKCPITSLQICTWSQKPPEFSYNTFKPLNGGHPRFLAENTEITQIWQWVWEMGGGGMGRAKDCLGPCVTALIGCVNRQHLLAWFPLSSSPPISLLLHSGWLWGSFSIKN